MRCSLKEALRGGCGASILCARGKDCGDEDTKGVARLGLDEFDNRSLARGEFTAEDAIDSWYIFYGHGHIISYLRAPWKGESLLVLVYVRWIFCRGGLKFGVEYGIIRDIFNS